MRLSTRCIFFSIILIFITYYFITMHDYKIVDYYDDYKDAKIKNQYSLLIEVDNTQYRRSGEREFARRLALVAHNFGFDVSIVDDVNKIDLTNKKIDFVVSVIPEDNRFVKPAVSRDYKHYVIMNMPMKEFFDCDKWYYPYYPLRDEFKYLSNYDGFLYSFQEGELLQKTIENKEKKFYGFRFFPYANKNNIEFDINKFQKPKLYYAGYNWDKWRGSDKYQDFYKLLGQKEYAHFYGPKTSYKQPNLGWVSDISKDGKSFFETTKEYPVALILHSDKHFENFIPTMRSFESIAAGNLVITDKHKFIQDNFQDSVFYIDITQDPSIMASEIEKHMNLIKNNPQKAMDMAKRAYKIFIENYTLEDNFLKIIKMHEIMTQKEM